MRRVLSGVISWAFVVIGHVAAQVPPSVPLTIKAVDALTGGDLAGVNIRLSTTSVLTDAFGGATVTVPGVPTELVIEASKSGYTSSIERVTVSSPGNYAPGGNPGIAIRFALRTKSDASALYPANAAATWTAAVEGLPASRLGESVPFIFQVSVPAGTFSEAFRLRATPLPTSGSMTLNGMVGAHVLAQVALEVLNASGESIAPERRNAITFKLGSLTTASVNLADYQAFHDELTIWSLDPVAGLWSDTGASVAIDANGLAQFDLAGFPPVLTLIAGDGSFIASQVPAPSENTTQIPWGEGPEEETTETGPLKKAGWRVTRQLFKEIISASDVECGQQAGSTEVELTAGTELAGSTAVESELKSDLDAETGVDAIIVQESVSLTIGASVKVSSSSSSKVSTALALKGGAPAGSIGEDNAGKSGTVTVYLYSNLWRFYRNDELVGQIAVPHHFKTVYDLEDDPDCD
jgi:hypothetical protein